MFLRYVAVPAIAVLFSATALPALAVDGLITKPSAHSADATIERFEAAVKKWGFMVFARLPLNPGFGRSVLTP